MGEMLERRRAPRVAIVGRPSACVRDNLKVWVADLSTTGARITLGELLHHGSSLVLDLPPALGSLSLAARVVWSTIYGGEQTLEGEHHTIYQSGLAFVGLTPDQQGALARIVESFLHGKVPDPAREAT
jgi:hypothetical protein